MTGPGITFPDRQNTTGVAADFPAPRERPTICATQISRSTVRDGTQVAYRREGSGPTVVLVHGGFLDHRALSGLQALLVADGHTVVAPDRRGHGLSDPDGADPQVPDDAGDLAEIIAAVTPSKTTVRVVAHSSGGHSALAAAALTNLIRDLVLYEPPRRRDDPAISLQTWTRLRDARAAKDRRKLVEVALAKVVGGATGQPPTVPLPPPFWDSPHGICALTDGELGFLNASRRHRSPDSGAIRQVLRTCH